MKTFINAALGAVCIATISLASGCAVAPADDDDAVDIAGAELGATAPPPRQSCFVGVWVESANDCNCPEIGTEGYTLECQASDCRETALLALDDDYSALRVTVRSSALQGRLTAVGLKSSEGTWKEGIGKLQLAFEYISQTAAQCSADYLELKGSPLMQRAAKPLADSIWWAWDYDHWLDVPYNP
jgi:hypothetical protein